MKKPYEKPKVNAIRALRREEKNPKTHSQHRRMGHPARDATNR
jgi:hypothetical protein